MEKEKWERRRTGEWLDGRIMGVAYGAERERGNARGRKREGDWRKGGRGVREGEGREGGGQNGTET